jgi:hypothetical protein
MWMMFGWWRIPLAFIYVQKTEMVMSNQSVGSQSSFNEWEKKIKITNAHYQYQPPYLIEKTTANLLETAADVQACYYLLPFKTRFNKGINHNNKESVYIKKMDEPNFGGAREISPQNKKYFYVQNLPTHAIFIFMPTARHTI